MMAIYPLLSEIPILSTLPRRGGTIKLNSIYSEGPLARLLYSHYSSITIINDIGNIMSSIHSFYLYDILQFTINWNLNRPHLACSSWYKPLNSNCWRSPESRWFVCKLCATKARSQYALSGKLLFEQSNWPSVCTPCKNLSNYSRLSKYFGNQINEQMKITHFPIMSSWLGKWYDKR